MKKDEKSEKREKSEKNMKNKKKHEKNEKSENFLTITKNAKKYLRILYSIFMELSLRYLMSLLILKSLKLFVSMTHLIFLPAPVLDTISEIGNEEARSIRKFHDFMYFFAIRTGEMISSVSSSKNVVRKLSRISTQKNDKTMYSGSKSCVKSSKASSNGT